MEGLNILPLAPTFEVKYRAKHSSFIIGNLEGNLNHGYIEPIYDYKLIIKERLENGFQFLVDTKPYNHDLVYKLEKSYSSRVINLKKNLILVMLAI